MKTLLRKNYLELRNQLNITEINMDSKLIIERIKQFIDFDSLNCIGFYMPLGNEVNLLPLMEELLKKHKTIVLPKVLDKATMEYFPITDLNDVSPSKFKVFEPNSTKKMPKNEIELLFIPGIAFNKNKYRLGFGAGYYDRYLSDYRNLKVGVCYDFQLINDKFEESYDIPMDLIITENREHPSRDAD